jgi:GT2 family glycosyltransferase
MMPRPELSIVITTYDVRELLLRCLDSLDDAVGSLRVEVVVVDNGFRDDSWQVLLKRDDVRAVRGSTHLGFGGANNIGAKVTQAPLILFLNPDTEAEPGSIELLTEALLCRSDVAVAGPFLYLDGERLDPAARRNFPSPVSAIHRFLGAPRFFRKLLARPYNELRTEGQDVGGC